MRISTEFVELERLQETLLTAPERLRLPGYPKACLSRHVKLSQPFHRVAILAFAVALARAAFAAEPQALVDTWQTGRSGGIAVAVVTADKVAFYQAGTFSADNQQPVGPDTLFEIGSVTKVFTAILLADAIEQGLVKLDDSVGVPFAKSDITYRQLVTHTSGLPRLPSGFRGHDPADPYANYGVDSLVREFAAAAPKAKPSPSAYSNFGFSVLGQAIAAANKESWPVAVRKRIIERINLADTSTSWREAEVKRLAPGHSAGKQVPSWSWDAYAPTGSMVSSARDLSRFVRTALGQIDTPLNRTIAATFRRIDGQETAMRSRGFAWSLERHGGYRIASHNGQTGGYHSFVGLDTTRQIGVVILANDNAEVEPLGYALLTGEPLPARRTSPGKKPSERKEIAMPTESLDAYVGHYELAPGTTLSVQRQSTHLAVQLTGQHANSFFAEEKDMFFHKAIDAQLTFERDAAGKVTAVILHQNGNNMRAPRIN